MTDSDETRTRAQREASLKDELSVFNQHIRNINKLTRRIHATSAKPNVVTEELQDFVGEYESILEELSAVYDHICELAFDSPPQKVVDSFERIDSESCKFLAETSCRIREINEKGRLDRSQSQEKQLFENLHRTQSEQSDSISKLCSQLVLNRLPSAEPDIFSGDPLLYNDWINSFEALISSRSLPDSEGIFYLKKYLSGEAKSCVQGLLSLSTSEAFHAALKLLKERFGDDFVIANAFRQKLRKWPKIQNHDYVGLRNFSDYLNNVLVAKESNRSLAILDDENENRILLYKIPDFCLNKWEDIVSSALMNDRGFPGFAEFCKLLRIQSKIKNNPITSVRSGAPSQSTSNVTPRSQGFSQSHQGSRFQQSNAQSFQRKYSHAAVSVPNSQNSISCFYCNQSHLMTNCKGFLSLSLNDRRQFCYSQRLCFGCLRHGHSNRDYQKRMQCSTCSGQHPTVLHDDNRQQRNFSQVPPLMTHFRTTVHRDLISKLRPQCSFKIRIEELARLVHRCPLNKDLKPQLPTK